MKIAFWISFPISLLLGWKLSTSIITDISTQMISFIGILLAGMMPTMVMSVSLMQGEALSIQSLNSLRDTLRQSITDISKAYLAGILAVVCIISLKVLGSFGLVTYTSDVIARVIAIIFYWSFFAFLISFPLLFSRIKSALQIRYKIERENALDKLNRLGRLEKKSLQTPPTDPDFGKQIGKLK